LSRLVRSCLVGLGLTVALVADDKGVAPKQLIAYGNDYPSACLPEEAARLRQEITRLAGLRNPAGAWALAQAMLCGREPSGDCLVLAHMPAQLRSTDDGPDGTHRSWVARSAELRRQGWAIGVSTALNVDDDLVMSFQTDEASVGSFTLRFRGKEWLLVALGSGGD